MTPLRMLRSYDDGVGSSLRRAEPSRLAVAGWLFGAASLVHLADHLRRGQGSVPELVYVAGTLALVLQVVIVVLAVTHRPEAPRWALLGFPLAAGFAAVHWLPVPAALGDPVWQIPTWTWFSYVASFAEILGGLGIGLIGARALLARRAPAPTAAARM